MKISGSGIGGWSRYALIFAVLLWITVLVFISNGVWRQDVVIQDPSCVHFNEQLRDVSAQMDTMRRELDALKAENTRLLARLPVDSASGGGAFHPRAIHPLHMPDVGAGGRAANIAEMHAEALYSKEHEISRRLLRNVIYETFLYLKSYADTSENVANKAKFDVFRIRIHDQMRSLLAEVENFGERVDEAGEWHRRSLAALTAYIQGVVHRLQHPTDCAKARYLTCDLNKGCGFGCQLHHVAYCLSIAAASNRTMVLENDGAGWRYSRHGWAAVFLPVSGCAATFAENADSDSIFTSINQTERVVRLPIVEILGVQVDQLPQSFPQQLADQLLTHHSNPSVFFVTQFLWYLMRENNETRAYLSKAEARIPFDKGPIVGVQIRRTDKIGTEAAFHSVEEYMEWAELWFRRQEARDFDKPLKRRVFVATDDPTAVKELKERYTNYEIYFNDGSAQSAQPSNRYTDASLYAIIADIRMLSKCDYLVCTFSSQVCRMGYELMQVLQGDKAEQFHSLDDIYYYGGQMAHDLVATGTYKTNVTGEIELQPGDVIRIAGNHWNGFSRGLNRRTGQSGLFPSYLAREQWRIVDFSIFGEVH